MTAEAIPQPETPFMNAVIEALELHGWLVYHTWRSDHSPKGFPDITAVRNGELLFIETKGIKKSGRRGKVSDEQWQWIYELAKVPKVNAFPMWPDEWEKLDPYLVRR